MLAIMLVGLLALAGLVVDGGAKLAAEANADAIAQEAARAGAGMVDRAQAYQTGSFRVDQAEAIAAAQNYLTAGGYRGSVQLVPPNSIRVTVTLAEPTRVLSIIGLSRFTVQGTATASLVTGITGGP
jgi:hypothetical protein